MNTRMSTATLFGLAILIVTLGSLFSYFVHNPEIGIDDANITQVYAKNIADGFGYVYNQGGERVEGSTSWVWTILNTGFFLLNNDPEKLIAIFCYLIIVLTVYESLRLIRHFSSTFEINVAVASTLLGSFLISYTSFFAWTVWALMDVTLWTYFFTLIVSRFSTTLINFDHTTYSNSSIWVLCASLATLPLIRPEGIAVSIGFSILFLAISHLNNLAYLRKALLITLFTSLILIAILTLWRIQHFGFPVPNTFYAKVSTDYLSQLIQGIIYIVRYLSEPTIIVQLIFALGLIGYVYSVSRHTFQYSNSLAIVWLSALFGVFSLYIALGGDHFGSARQYQVLTPVLSTLASLGVALLISNVNQQIDVKNNLFRKQFWVGSIVISVIFVFIPSIAYYTKDKGNIDREFRLAENGRTIGTLLNQLPSKPSLGVMAAGGIARTYDGHIYDLMGLNWTSMAHANRVHNPNAPKNHAAFTKDVFYDHYPDIVLPELGKCVSYYGEHPDSFHNRAVNGMLLEERFKAKYVRACFKEVTFYIKKDLFKNLSSILRLAN